MPGDQDQKDQGLRLDTDAWNLIYGDPTAKDGYFIGGAGEKGARWATTGGGFTGNIGENGLQSHIGLGGDMSLQLGGDFKQKMATLGLESGGTELGQLYGKGSGLDNWEAGLRGSYGLGGGFQLDPSLSYVDKDGKGAGVAGFGLTHGDDKLTGSYTLGEDANKLGLGLVQGLGNGLTSTRGTSVDFGNGSVENSFKLSDPTDTFGFTQGFGKNGETDTLSFAHKYGGGSFNGSVTGGDAISGFSLGAAQSLPGGGSLSERFGMSFGDKGPTTTFGMGSELKPFEGMSLGSNFDAKLGPGGAYDLSGKLSESYRSKGFAETLSLGGSSSSDKGGSFTGNGSATAQIVPGLYGSGFGSFGGTEGKDPSWFAGGGLTYMPTDKLGITAAGGYGSEGWEARLQADFFKKGVDGAGSLEDQRKKAMFSGYLGISGGGGSRMNDVFGAGDLDKSWNTGAGPTVTLGVGVGF